MNKEMYNFFRQLWLLHIFMALTQIVLAAIIIAVTYNSGAMSPELEEMVYVAGFAALAGIALPKVVKAPLLKPAKEATMPEAKRQKYKGASITLWAMMEGANAIVLVALLLTGIWYLLILFVALIFFFYMARPTPIQFVRDLEISKKEAISLGLMDSSGR